MRIIEEEKMGELSLDNALHWNTLNIFSTDLRLSPWPVLFLESHLMPPSSPLGLSSIAFEDAKSS